jgi:GcrA cell cycle regulator
MSTGWDSNKLKKLKSLIGKGLSTSEIGKRLEMSKNAVVGKLNRLGWNLKAMTGSARKTPDVKDSDKKVATKKSKLPIAKKIAPVKPVVMPKATAKKTTKKVAETKTVKPSKVVNKPKTAKPTTNTVEKTEIKRLPSARSSSNKKTNSNLAMHQRIIQHSLELASLKPNQCRWPIGDPDSENFHFCGETVFVGKPYCYEHCKQAYQFTPPKKK